MQDLVDDREGELITLIRAVRLVKPTLGSLRVKFKISKGYIRYIYYYLIYKICM